MTLTAKIIFGEAVPAYGQAEQTLGGGGGPHHDPESVAMLQL